MSDQPASVRAPKHRRLSFMDGLVVAISKGEKDVTRRLLNPQPTEPILWYPSAEHKRGLAYDGEAHFLRGVARDFAPLQPGDILDVCEALVPVCYDINGPDSVYYRADRNPVVVGGNAPEWPWKVRALPARYCPSWAVRHHREILSVRPERLSWVTDAEAVREGVARLGWAPTREGFLAGFRALHGLEVDDDPWVFRIEFSTAPS
jgi:hypothetical protein